MKRIFTSVLFTLIAIAGTSQIKAYISTDKAIADINSMIKNIEEIHYNPYFKINKDQFNEYKDELLNEFNTDSILLKKFVSTGMKLAAQMSGGHTAMDWQNESLFPELMTYRFVPFTGKISEENQQFIVTQSANPEVKKGAVIKTINGVKVTELYLECMTLIGGVASFKNFNCEKIFPLYLFFTDRISAPYSLVFANDQKEPELEGLDVTKLNELISQGQVKEDYTFEIIEDNIGLLTYNRCVDYDVFKTFLKQTFADIKTKNLNKLIIDIRGNSGGDSRLNDLLLSYITTIPYRQSSGRYWKVSNQAKIAYQNDPIYKNNFGKKFLKKYEASQNASIIESFDDELINPKKPTHFFSGRTCFLIGSGTFSSANFLADAIKTYKLSTLIGSATGELTNDFGELIDFTLPNSGNYVYVSSTYDIGAGGNANVYEPVSPHIQTKRDALQYAIEWINQSNN